MEHNEEARRYEGQQFVAIEPLYRLYRGNPCSMLHGVARVCLNGPFLIQLSKITGDTVELSKATTQEYATLH